MSSLPIETEQALALVKPRLRGVFHTFGFFASLFGIAQFAMAPVEGWRYVAGLVYASSLALMLGLSALYHRPTWSHAARNRLRKADHIGIFGLIAGSYTPLAAFVSPHGATVGLVTMWVGAVAGTVYAVANSHGHRGLRAALYVVLGWAAAPLMISLPSYIGWPRTELLLGGAFVYMVGAVVYAKRWPNPAPSVFGYHEIFHLLVLAAAGLNYAAIWSLQHA